MTFVRPARRVLIAAASLSALFVAAACGGGGGGEGAPEGGGTSAAADFTKQGDIEVWQGKDTSGNFPKLIAQFKLPKKLFPIGLTRQWSNVRE